jgi:hypothetical protein
LWPISSAMVASDSPISAASLAKLWRNTCGTMSCASAPFSRTIPQARGMPVVPPVPTRAGKT